ncbi:MAG: tyrosine-type recombinase/integrase [Deferribacterales bacterium]
MGGTQVRGKKNQIRVFFVYRGIRCFEPTKYMCETGNTGCNCQQCRLASAYVAEIDRKIKEGIFRYGDYFPKSKNLKKFSLSDTSKTVGFSVYAQQWLRLKEKSLAYSTLRTYTGFINIFCDYFKNIPISDIKASTVQGFIREYDIAPKTMSNMIGMLSSIFKTAVADDILDKNPCGYVSKPRVQSAEIDPFEQDEIELILDWMDKHHPHMTAFFAVAFFSGMRTGEIMAMKWNDIDFRRNKIHVRRTMTKGQIKESTKTKESRTIDIETSLDPYLSRHKQYSFMKSDWMFTSYLGEPFHQIQNVSKTYYEPCLKALGIKYRNIYQTRHTFACLFIEAGAQLNWIKNMLGHSTLQMLLKTYGNRINKDSAERVSILNSTSKSAKNVPNEKANG